MNESDLEFIIESLLLTIVNGDLDGLQIMFDWGVELMDGDSDAFVETVLSGLLKKGKQEAASVLEEYAKSLV